MVRKVRRGSPCVPVVEAAEEEIKKLLESLGVKKKLVALIVHPVLAETYHVSLRGRERLGIPGPFIDLAGMGRTGDCR